LDTAKNIHGQNRWCCWLSYRKSYHTTCFITTATTKCHRWLNQVTWTATETNVPCWSLLSKKFWQQCCHMLHYCLIWIFITSAC